jgi:hypothetical protein
MIRKILSVVAGYMVFAVSSVLLFNLTSQHPHQDASVAFKCVTIVYGIFFSILSGFVVQLIAVQKNLTLNYILAVLMGLLAALSLLTSTGNHWTQLLAIFIFAPSSIVGGYLKNKLSANK